MTELNKEAITTLLATNDKAVARALVLLKNRQTFDERESEQTKHLNGRGFRPCHAKKGTSMALWFEKTGFLTPKMVAYWRKQDKTGAMRIGIYWGQLVEEAMKKRGETA